MKNHPLYKRLKQIVLDGDYTIEQVKSLRFGQAVELLETREFDGTFLNNMKRGLIDAIRGRNDVANTETVKGKIKTWLNNNYPDWEIEHGREGDKPFVKIWLEGKPGE